MPTTIANHITINADGVPYIKGTRTKVIEVALDRLAYNWDADEIHRQHPHLTLGQIHAALSHYYDHEEELNRDIEARMQRADAIKSKTKPSRLRLRLKARGDRGDSGKRKIRGA